MVLKLLTVLNVLICFSSGREECSMPSSFGSFSGRPAQSINDCFWDFAQCSQQEDLYCCQTRFDQCCIQIMTMPALEIPSSTTTTTTTTSTTTTTTRATICTSPTAPLTLIKCVWQFNCCVQSHYEQRMDDAACFRRFDDCKMIVMGMVPVSPEIPRPFMSIETSASSKPQSTDNNNMPMPVITSQGSKSPSLIDCLWTFFKCHDASACQKNWDECMMAAMSRNGP